MVANLDADAILREARQDGTPAYVLPSAGLVNRDSFFEAVRRSLPLDPPLVGTRSWDALSDSLWGGLDALNNNRIVIIWPNSVGMSRASQKDYTLALKVLQDVAASLADPRATNGKPKEIYIYVG